MELSENNRHCTLQPMGVHGSSERLRLQQAVISYELSHIISLQTGDDGEDFTITGSSLR